MRCRSLVVGGLLLGGGVVLLLSGGVGRDRAGDVRSASSGSDARTADTRGEPSVETSGVPLSIPGLLQDVGGHLRARAGVVVHVPSGRILREQDAFQEFPMASLTKLMSTMVALDHGVDLDREVSIVPGEFTIGGNLRIVPAAETVLARDLLYASITGSANNAALALARSTGIPPEEFVQEMNRKAVVLGLERTRFEDPSGLSGGNVGSAYDVAQLAGVALTDYPLIRDAASRASHTIVTRNTQREHVVKNPNTLFERFPGTFTASKTGYLDEALYCLVLARETRHGLIIAVLLGHPSKVGIEDDALALLNEGEERLASLATDEGEGVQ